VGGYEIPYKAIGLLAGGICCLVAVHWNKFRANPHLAFALPILMSFDNLAYGVEVRPNQRCHRVRDHLRADEFRAECGRAFPL
jgi:hypothetical protein